MLTLAIDCLRFRQVNILREFRHSNIVRYYDRIIDKSRTKIYIVMEYCAGGDLAAYIKKCRREKRRIDEDVIWKAPCGPFHRVSLLRPCRPIL
mgnify:CR=1 FL=1